MEKECGCDQFEGVDVTINTFDMRHDDQFSYIDPSAHQDSTVHTERQVESKKSQPS